MGESARRIMTADEVRRALVRISHEIVEKHGGTSGLALVGIHRRGVPLAHRIREAIEQNEGVALPVGALDITFHRDDLARLEHGSYAEAASALAARQPTASRRPAGLRSSLAQPQVKGTDLPFDLGSSTLVVVDDVLYTGRTVRAAMDALVEHGRPLAVRLAVLVDRGHRELPIRADHVGKNVPTSQDEVIAVRLHEIDGGEDEVVILPVGEPVAIESVAGAGGPRLG